MKSGNHGPKGNPGPGSVMNARPADSTENQRILEWLSACQSSTLYHDPRWMEIIEKEFGHRCTYLVSENREGAITGVLPLVYFRSPIFGKHVVSMPFVNYGGVCAEDGGSRSVLVGEGIRLASDLKAKFLELRQQVPLQIGLASRSTKVSMRLNLPESEETLWSSFSSKLRSQIRGSQKRNLSVRVGRFEELDRFYEVFSRNMRDLGTPVLPKLFFRSILEYFPNNTWIVNVLLAGEPVAAGFLAGYKEQMEIPWASSLRKFNRLGVNMLLYWSCLAFACDRGFSVFDFGRSTPGEGTYKFKEQWGAKPHSLHWHYWLRSGTRLPNLTNRNQKFRIAIKVWKKLPLSLTRYLGPKIVKNIP